MLNLCPAPFPKFIPLRACADSVSCAVNNCSTSNGSEGEHTSRSDGSINQSARPFESGYSWHMYTVDLSRIRWGSQYDWQEILYFFLSHVEIAILLGRVRNGHVIHYRCVRWLPSQSRADLPRAMHALPVCKPNNKTITMQVAKLRARRKFWKLLVDAKNSPCLLA